MQIDFQVGLLKVLVLEEHRVGGAYVLLVVVVANDLHIVQTELDFDALIGRGEETEGVEGELELGTDADEDAALGLYTVLPAELEGQDVFVLVRLQWEKGQWEECDFAGSALLKQNEILRKKRC